MKYAYFWSSILLTLSALFCLGLFVYHYETNIIIRKHIIEDMKNDIKVLSFKAADALTDSDTAAMNRLMRISPESRGGSNDIYILDSSGIIRFSSDRNLVGHTFTYPTLPFGSMNIRNFDEGYCYYSDFPVKNSKTAGYILVVKPEMTHMQKEMIRNMHIVFAVLALFVIIMLSVVLIATAKVIVKPITQLKEYTKDKNAVPEKFFITEFEDLRKDIIGYIQGLISMQEYSRAILDSQDDIILISDGIQLVDANKAFYRFFSDCASLDEFNHKYHCVCDLFEESDKADYLTKYDKLNNVWINRLLDNPEAVYKVKIIKNDVPYIFRFSVGRVHLDSFNRFIVVMSDVTLTEKYQDNLEQMVNEEMGKREETEKKYQYLFNSLVEGLCIYSFDESGLPSAFLEVNDRLCEIFGYNRQELMTMTPLNLYSLDIQEDMKDHVGDIQEKGYLNFETSLISKSGEALYCEVFSKFLNYYGEKTVFTSVRDITNRHKLEEKNKEQQNIIIQQSKLSTLGEMLGSISHQWKQPLNAISLIAQCIAEDIENGTLNAEKSERDISKIIDQVEFMSQTMNDFRNFYKPSVQKTVFSVSAVILEIYNILKQQYKQAGMNLIILKSDDVDDSVCGFPSEFKQVIMNLLNNTKDALVERKQLPEFKGRISGDVGIKVESSESLVTIEYSDSAGGVSAQIMKNMFKPYNTTKGEQGTGIGLHISRQIIERMNGRISACNIDNGVLFKIEIKTAKNKALISD